MDLGLNGKKAFVAGSSKGIGFAAASALAQEGCQVVINGRNQDTLEKAAQKIAGLTGEEVGFCAGDAADPAQGPDLVECAAQRLDGLDMLVTNTGGPPSGSFESFDENTWQRSLELVFMSHVRLIRASLPYLRESSHASALTITSISVKQPIPNLVLSNSIRAATVGLTKSLALELGPEGIRFNSLLPGWTKTERVQDLLNASAERNGTTIDDEIEKITRECPLGRMSLPEEVGRVAAFLLSPAASYITGVMLNVDGGMYKGTL